MPDAPLPPMDPAFDRLVARVHMAGAGSALATEDAEAARWHQRYQSAREALWRWHCEHPHRKGETDGNT